MKRNTIIILIVFAAFLIADSFNGGGGSSSSSGAVTQISKQVLASPASSVTFSSISSSFTNLQVFMQAASSQAAASADNVIMRANGDTGTNYDQQQLTSFSTTASSANTVATANPAVVAITSASGVANTAGLAFITIPNYGGTTFQKEGVVNAGWETTQANAGINTLQVYWHWRNTAAITSLTFLLSSGANFVTGSTFVLYGFN